jgi:hypothetical protein
MTDLKTKKNSASVTDFLNGIEDADQRRDCKTVAKMMRDATGSSAKMWGSSIVGYGTYHYVYASGREGDWMLTGFSPRKQAVTVYIMSGFKAYEPLLKKLGKFKTGKSCLYIKRLSDVDTDVLQTLIRESVKAMREKYPVNGR